jgi:toxin ParE1/3/4
MRALRVSPRARADLDEIWHYTNGRWGAVQAEAYLRLLNDSFDLACSNPLIGRDAGAIKRGYRKLNSGSHVIYYRLVDGAIEVMRILHKRMDAERHL